MQLFGLLQYEVRGSVIAPLRLPGIAAASLDVGDWVGIHQLYAVYGLGSVDFHNLNESVYSRLLVKSMDVFLNVFPVADLLLSLLT